MVGSRDLTPVAKWFRINADNSFQSGNGWLQNAVGTYRYDKKNHTYSATTTNGIKDTYGAFMISFDDGKMFWEREEDGMKVLVTLKPIKEMPMSTADKLEGLWDLVSLNRDGNDETTLFDPDNKHYLFIRWDHVVVERTPAAKRINGYWHIDGHHPEVTFFYPDGDHGFRDQRWSVEVTETRLTITGISEHNKGEIRRYKRILEFPD